MIRLCESPSRQFFEDHFEARPAVFDFESLPWRAVSVGFHQAKNLKLDAPIAAFEKLFENCVLVLVEPLDSPEPRILDSFGRWVCVPPGPRRAVLRASRSARSRPSSSAWHL